MLHVDAEAPSAVQTCCQDFDRFSAKMTHTVLSVCVFVFVCPSAFFVVVAFVVERDTRYLYHFPVAYLDTIVLPCGVEVGGRRERWGSEPARGRRVKSMV